MHSECSTPSAIVLMGFRERNDTFIFPSENEALPGVHLGITANTSLLEQLQAKLCRSYDLSPKRLKLTLLPDFSDVFLVDGHEITLYTGIGHSAATIPPGQTLPALLRKMPPTKVRAAYLRAWQALMGGTF